MYIRKLGKQDFRLGCSTYSNHGSAAWTK